MTHEEKQLLLKDLCARLPYGVNANISFNTKDDCLNSYPIVGIVGMKIVSETDVMPFSTDIENIKPYLRPMSSMTEEERKEYNNLCYEEEREQIEFGEWVTRVYYHNTIESIDWLNAHHFDFRRLIEKGLALEAPII